VSVRGYTLGVNWSRGTDYSGALEDVSSYAAGAENIVTTWGRTDRYTSSDARASDLTFSLLNHGREFSPENTGSPIYGRQLVGTPAKLELNGTVIASGVIGGYEVDSNRGEKTFTAECTDAWTRLGETQLSTAVLQGQRTGDLIDFILDEIGWPASARSIDSGATLVPYWWADGVDAKTAMLDLVHSEGEPAIAYVRNGVFTFRDRHHRLTRTASLTSQGTHTHIVPAGPIGTDHKILKDSFVYSHGLDRIINIATLEVTLRRPGREAVVWSNDDPIVLAASEVRTIIVRTDEPFLNMILPDEDLIYLNEGTFTTDYTLASGSISWGLSRTSGQSAYLTMTAGGGGAVINTGLRIRATPLIEGATQKFTASDATSIAVYGESEWASPSAPWAYYYDAQAIVEQMVATYSQPQPSVEFQIEGVLGSDTMARIEAAEIGDRITVRNDEIGLNADFHIEQLTHVVKKLGMRHTLTVAGQVCAPVQAATPFTFGVAGRGFNQGQFTAFAGNSPATMFRFNTAGQGFNQGVFAT